MRWRPVPFPQTPIREVSPRFESDPVVRPGHLRFACSTGLKAGGAAISPSRCERRLMRGPRSRPGRD